MSSLMNIVLVFVLNARGSERTNKSAGYTCRPTVDTFWREGFAY